MPLMPSNPNYWDEYLQQVYNARLSSVIIKEKAQFEKEVYESYDKFKFKLWSHLEILNKFLKFPSEYPRRHPFPKCIIKLRKVISDIVSNELH